MTCRTRQQRWSHRRPSFFGSALLLAFLLTIQEAMSLTFKIDPYLDECFLMHTPKTDLKLFVSGSFKMVDEGNLSGEPILMYIMDAATDELLYQSKPGNGRGSFRVPLNPSQKYWLCVQNNSRGPNDEDTEHPDHLPRTVGLRYRLERVAETAGDPLDPHNQKLHAWLQNAGEVFRELSILEDHMAYSKMREAGQRGLTEKTFTEIMNWTIIEAGAVITVALAQIFYFRMFLEKKRYM